MSIQGALYELVTGDAVVAALIGDRMYPLTLPQDVNGAGSAVQYPAVVQRMVAQEVDYTTGAKANILASTMEVDVFGETYASARAVAEALFDLWDGWRGTAGDQVISTMLVNRQEEQYVDVGGGGGYRYRIRFWLAVQHKRVS